MYYMYDAWQIYNATEDSQTLCLNEITYMYNLQVHGIVLSACNAMYTMMF